MAQLSSYVVMSNYVPSCECEFDTEPPHRDLHPFLFTKSVWVVSRPIHLLSVSKGCKTESTVSRPYPRRIESLTVCRYHYTFFSVT